VEINLSGLTLSAIFEACKLETISITMRELFRTIREAFFYAYYRIRGYQDLPMTFAALFLRLEPVIELAENFGFNSKET
jgi:hypothetical protein